MTWSYSLIWATGSVPDVPALLPYEQEPSGENDGYMRTQCHAVILPMFLHEDQHVHMKNAWGLFYFSSFLPVSLNSHNIQHVLVLTSDQFKWKRARIICSDSESSFCNCLVFIRTRLIRSGRTMSHTLWLSLPFRINKHSNVAPFNSTAFNN